MNDYLKANWILEGLTVRANYYGKEVQGVVTESRVKYGGKVQHTLRLTEGLVLNYNEEPRFVCLVDHEEITAVVDSN